MILVAGPPCGGKTTYVREHAAHGELILDFDDIVEHFSGGTRYTREPNVIEAARIEWSRRLPSADWAIWTAPRRRQRGKFQGQYGATIIIVLASLDECLKRADQFRPPGWRDSVYEWFSQWEPSQSGRETIIDTTPRLETA